MLKSITLQNFKSFGEKQTVPLQPITVLVGPNNSGKSNFLSLGRFMRNSLIGRADVAIEVEGGADFLFHRPAFGDGRLVIECAGDQGGHYSVVLDRDTSAPGGVAQSSETMRAADGSELWFSKEGQIVIPGGPRIIDAKIPLVGLREVARLSPIGEKYTPAAEIFKSWYVSEQVKLSLQALRQDAEVVPEPKLGPDGSGLAAVLALWRGAEPERSTQLDDFLRNCMPSIRHALVKPAPKPSFQRLWVQQSDGELFDADHVSDGVLFFTGLAMQIIDAGKRPMVFLEEPEQSIHPRKLGDIVNLLRKAVEEQGCQFVIATHSPVLLNEFRDEPEAIVLFRRGEHGTKVKTLAEIPELLEVLQKSDPGAMLSDGFFNHPF